MIITEISIQEPFLSDFKSSYTSILTAPRVKEEVVLPYEHYDWLS